MSLLFETIKVAQNALLDLDYHRARVNRSRCRLFSANDEWDLRSLIQLPELDPDVVYKCRFVYGEKVQSVEVQPYVMRTVRTLKLVECPAIEYSLKYADRSSLDKVKQENPSYDDVIFVQNNKITDCSFANIVFYDGMKWVTPAKPLLKGTKRQKYLDSQVIFEQDITVSDLKLFTKARIINAMIDLDDCPDIPAGNIAR